MLIEHALAGGYVSYIVTPTGISLEQEEILTGLLFNMMNNEHGTMVAMM